MELYASSKNCLRYLTSAKQGYIAALRDLERLKNAKNAAGVSYSRVRYENGVLCQADNVEEKWHCKGRFVWAVDSTGTKAMLWGYLPEHEKGKMKSEYDRLKSNAHSVDDAFFTDDKKLPSSRELELQQQAEQDAKKATRAQKYDVIVFLARTYDDLCKEAETDTGDGAYVAVEELFRGEIARCLKENPEMVQDCGGFRDIKRALAKVSKLDPPIVHFDRFATCMWSIHGSMLNKDGKNSVNVFNK